MDQHRFQVDLRGIIDLLANHLYSSPNIFIRELLQNAVDAIRARQTYEPGFTGSIDLELVEGTDGSPPTLIFRDDGLGLTEEEIHQFLATIGASSKRDALDELRRDFIGQFGIGLLSCFLVAREVVLVTRSARKGAPTLKWTGSDQGTYRVDRLSDDLLPGTTVYLRARPDRLSYFEPALIRDLAAKYGGILPVPVDFRRSGEKVRVNDGAPWRWEFAGRADRDRAMREYCRKVFKFEPLDWLPLRSAAGEADGVAFVMPTAMGLGAQASHRLYMRNMLLSEGTSEILPSWACFVRAVVNVNNLRPTASREALYQDEELTATQRTLGRSLKRYLFHLADDAPGRLREIVGIHHLPMRSLALEDDEFFRLVVHWIPFETSAGWMTLGEYLEENDVLRYATTSDQFRELAPIATARSLVIVNAGHTFDREFIEKLGRLDPDTPIRRVDALALIGEFADPPPGVTERLSLFLATAAEALDKHGCGVELKSFPPADLPALYCMNNEQGFERSIGIAKEKADSLWSGMMDQLRQATDAARARAILVLNERNPLIRRVARVTDREALGLTAEILYVQALLLGHHPLRPAETKVLSTGLIRILELGLDGGAG